MFSDSLWRWTDGRPVPYALFQPLEDSDGIKNLKVSAIARYRSCYGVCTRCPTNFYCTDTNNSQQLEY